MVQTLLILETILLGFTGIVTSVSMIRILTTKDEEEYSLVTAVVFTIMLVASILGLRLIWL